jgi:hypothetical protein
VKREGRRGKKGVGVGTMVWGWKIVCRVSLLLLDYMSGDASDMEVKITRKKGKLIIIKVKIGCLLLLGLRQERIYDNFSSSPLVFLCCGYLYFGYLCLVGLHLLLVTFLVLLSLLLEGSLVSIAELAPHLSNLLSNVAERDILVLGLDLY